MGATKKPKTALLKTKKKEEEDIKKKKFSYIYKHLKINVNP
jgi:hypothetical protein